MTSDELALLVGAVVSLLFSYIPGLSTWFAGLSVEVKRLIMAGLMAVVALVVFGLSCTTWAADLGITVTCNQAGAVGLIRAFIAAVVANQGVYGISAYSKSRKAIA